MPAYLLVQVTLVAIADGVTIPKFLQFTTDFSLKSSGRTPGLQRSYSFYLTLLDYGLL